MHTFLGMRRYAGAFVFVGMFYLLFCISTSNLWATPITKAEMIPLRIGEHITLELSEGESIGYIIEIIEEGQYVLIPDDEEHAIVVDIFMTNSAGEEVLDDALATHELELNADFYTLQFSATEDVAVTIVLVSNTDVLSEDPDIPGELVLGGLIYSNIDVGSKPITDALADGGRNSYQFSINEAGSLVTVTLFSEVTDTDFDLSVGMLPDNQTWHSTNFASNESIRFVAPRAGIYFVDVYSINGEGEYTLAVKDNGLAPKATVNGATWGVLLGAEHAVYRLQIDEPGQLLTVILLGPTGEDFDLEVVAYGDSNYPVLTLSGYGYTAEEVVGKVNPDPGLYEIRVKTSGVGGNFVLITRLEDPYALTGQWAIEATASSQYSNDDWSAMQATGAPNTPRGQDMATAWAAALPDKGLETLELTYAQRVNPLRVVIYETYAPGGVVMIEAYDTENGEWVVLWEGENNGQAAGAVFNPPLDPVEFTTNMIRVTVDTRKAEDYEQIDAVLLAGRPKNRSAIE